ncbi:unnamed protein product [Clonostachys solani]|uniref:BTB domain-containing protein n=1 Tax=Clonostachys solani TaxID=160281 RepID=A0A9P0EEI9_9HYPO|nr:unnamed protein product [Clonostachys solani]
MDATPPKMLVFDEDGDTLIILPYITSASEAADDQKSDPNVEQNGEKRPAEDALEKNEVRMKVSKKHMMLASRRAQKIFLGPWKETESRGTDGLHHWLFEPVFTPEAFEIVLNIIHGQTRGVPDQIGLATLADIAALVDDLQCEDAVWFIVKSWIRLLQEPLPHTICEDLVRWILISSVFDEPSIFQDCTKVAIQSTCKQLDTTGLPIRPSIIDGIEVERIKILDALMVDLEDQRDGLSRGELGCNLECRSSYLGALIQGMHSTGILPILDVNSPTNDPYEAPHRGLRVSSAMKAIREMPFPDVYITNIYSSRPSFHTCNLRGSLWQHLDEVEAEIMGLNLNEFMPK